MNVKELAHGEGLIKALMEEDATARQAAVVAWRNAALAEIEQVLPSALDDIVQRMVEARLATRNYVEPWSNRLKSHKYALTLQFQPVRDVVVTTTSQLTGPVALGGGSLAGGSGPTPNDNRSNSLNPNNSASHAAANNHANQMNPNNPAYGSSRGGGGRR